MIDNNIEIDCATTIDLILEQQFTAFKPLAHRPKPMLARP